MSGMIPVNPEDLPIEAPYIDDTSAVYHVELNSIKGPKADKNGVLFIGYNTTITEGDYEGFQIGKNYVKLPLRMPADAKKKERLAIDRHNSDFGRFSRAFKPRGPLEPLYALTDPEGGMNNSERVAAAREYLEQCIGNTAPVTVENSEFPQGSGKMRSAINDVVV